MNLEPPRAVTRLVSLALYVGLPLVGLFAWGWDWRPIVVLYWLENLTTGGLTLISLIRRRRAGELTGGMHPAFFVVHFGIFTLVHGVFVIAMVNVLPSIAGAATEPFSPWWVLAPWAVATLVQWGVAMFAPTPFTDGIARAYGRVFALHLAILGGVFVIIVFQLPAIVAAALVVLHLAADAVVGAIQRATASGKWTATATSPGQWRISRTTRIDG